MPALTGTVKTRVACIIPTYNGRADLSRLFDSLCEQSLLFDLFVVDSSSNDGTPELVRSRECNLVSISSREFNHGGTRQMMVESNSEYDIYVFLTQDAYLENQHALEKLIAPFSDARVGAVCGRQLPHLNATPLAAHARLFNYPPTSIVKSIDDAAKLGVKTAFISNSFSAYRRDALLEVGGFPADVILSEDMYVAAKMLISGWKVAYEGSACCRHSHNYTIAEEFRRYFDIGVFFAREPWVLQQFGNAGGEGFRFVKSEMAYLGMREWPWIINSIVRNGCKLLAFKLGKNEIRFPVKLKKKLSMHKRFWDTDQKECG